MHLYVHSHAQTYIRTQKWTKWTNVRSCCAGHASRVRGLSTTSGNSEPALDILYVRKYTPEVGPGTYKNTGYASHFGVGIQSPTCSSVQFDIASDLVHLQPRPGPQFIVLLRTG